jgi:DsbC/DsbD-like thiol-disulfide interchange protein
MKRPWCLGEFVAILCASTAMCFGAPAAVPHARIELVSEQDTLQAGRMSHLGLKFDLEPGWHIYWINAGDSGQPPDVKWSTPHGIRVGEFVWPVPKRLKTGPLVDYGYEGSVLLMAPITVQGNTTRSAQVDAQVRLVVCEEVCVPGKASLSMNLKVSSSTPHPGTRADLFSIARTQIPQNLPPGCMPSAIDDGENFRLRFRCTTLPQGLTFFPLHPNEIENAAPQRQSRSNNGIELTLRKSEQLIRPPERLEGLIAGSGEGWEVSVPIAKNFSERKE